MNMLSGNLPPFPVLTTERLTLRQLLDSDDTEIFALRSNEQVNRYLDRKPSESIEDAQRFIATINENLLKQNTIYWAITGNNRDELIGTICLFHFSEDRSGAEIGFELLPRFHRKGLMQEAAEKVVSFAFHDLGLTSIEASAHRENVSSARLLEKLNFSRQGVEGTDFITFELTN